MTGKRLGPRSRDQVYQEQRRKGGCEHGEVHAFWVTATLIFEGTDQSEQDDGKGEFESPEAESDDARHCGVV